jgi:hypothetical protein
MEELIKLRQKYIDAELAGYRKYKIKSKTLRAKISVLTELANILNVDLTKKTKT